jgi:hypothetical protein
MTTSKRWISVEEELENFEYKTRDLFIEQLSTNIDFNYLREVDELDNRSNELITSISYHAVKDLIDKYKDSRVSIILTNIAFIFKVSLYSGLNLPMHIMPEIQVERVIDNALSLYKDNMYVHLKHEMIMMNHHVMLIQRNWRRVISDPYHSICKRRIARNIIEENNITDNDEIAELYASINNINLNENEIYYIIQSNLKSL